MAKNRNDEFDYKSQELEYIVDISKMLKCCEMRSMCEIINKNVS